MAPSSFQSITCISVFCLQTCGKYCLALDLYWSTKKMYSQSTTQSPNIWSPVLSSEWQITSGKCAAITGNNGTISPSPLSPLTQTPVSLLPHVLLISTSPYWFPINPFQFVSDSPPRRADTTGLIKHAMASAWLPVLVCSMVSINCFLCFTVTRQALDSPTCSEGNMEFVENKLIGCWLETASFEWGVYKNVCKLNIITHLYSSKVNLMETVEAQASDWLRT